MLPASSQTCEGMYVHVLSAMAGRAGVLAIIEVRNAGRPGTYVPEDWATEDEEILAAVVSQISVTLNNVLCVTCAAPPSPLIACSAH